jgi:hypothetical protein
VKLSEWVEEFEENQNTPVSKKSEEDKTVEWKTGSHPRKNCLEWVTLLNMMKTPNSVWWIRKKQIARLIWAGHSFKYNEKVRQRLTNSKKYGERKQSNERLEAILIKKSQGLVTLLNIMKRPISD